MHVRRALALAVLLATTVGCTSEMSSPDGSAEPRSSPVPSTAGSPSSQGGGQGEVDSPEKPSDYIRRWVEASNEMQTSGDTGAYLRLSGRCPACKRVAERVDSIFDSGGFLRTEGWRILRINRRTLGPGMQVLDVRVDSAPTVIRSGESARERYPGGVLTYRFRLTSRAPWSIVRLTQLPS